MKNKTTPKQIGQLSYLQKMKLIGRYAYANKRSIPICCSDNLNVDLTMQMGFEFGSYEALIISHLSNYYELIKKTNQNGTL